MSKEKAELLNGIMRYLHEVNALTDMYGTYDIHNPFIAEALKGLEKNGYVKLTIPEDKDEILFVALTEYGKGWVSKGGLFQ